MMDLLVAAASAATTTTLAAGLLLWMRPETAAAADLVVNTGLLILIATPVARLAGGIVEELRAREWRFAALGAAALVLLVGSLLYYVGS
jgi:uncharacterized membrane protein